jgi:pyruvate,water dikinase
MKDTFLTLLESWIGPIDHDPALDETLLFFAGGRMYMNMSNILWLSSPKKLARSSSPTDARLAEIFANIDAKTYRAAKKPPWLNLRVLWLFPKVLWRLRRFFWNTARAFAFPERARRDYQQVVVAYENRLANDVDYALPWDEFLETYYAKLMQHLFDDTMPALLVGIAGVGMVDWAVGKRSAELRVLGEQLKVGFPGNVVSQMGIDLFRLAKQLDPAEFDDLPRLAKRIEQRQMPAEFLAAWDAFEAKFGCRGPLEMDLARPRYGDDPRIALEQMSYMEMADEQFDPERTHQRQVEAREGAYDELRRRLDWPWRALLRRAHRYIELFAGTRDTPKYHNLLAYHAVRRRALMEGQKLVDAGRLDEAADVFNLTLDDLARADCDASLDLRRIGQERAAALREIGARVRQFPSVIDSRGRILRPAPRAEKPGELSGLGVSPGVVTGPVKLLHDPHEKPVDKGDILVAYTTDPGWTPLFVNAAAVVLEVGGVLQHGAVVAREYGKPCVVGIDQVMQRLRDGQQVEVDGSSGTVRVLS